MVNNFIYEKNKDTPISVDWEDKIEKMFDYYDCEDRKNVVSCSKKTREGKNAT